MRKDLSVILRYLAPVKPQKDLSLAVLLRIRDIERRTARLRLVFLGSTTAASVALFFPALRFAMTEFAHTGFGEYLSLLLSDGGAVLAYWHELLLLLAESLPVLALTFLFFIAFVFLGSLRLLLINARIAFMPNYSL